MRFAEVAVDAPTGYDRTFSYSIPESLDVRPGHLVRVPFGPRTLQGVVFSLPDVAQVSDTREILATRAPDPVLTDAQLRLSRWVSRYYMSSLFDAAALMLPPGGRERLKIYLSVAQHGDPADESRLTTSERRVLDYIRRRATVEQGRLVRGLGDWSRAVVGRLVDKRILVRTPGRSRSPVGPRYRRNLALGAGSVDTAKQWLAAAAKRAPRQAALVTRLLGAGPPLDIGEARAQFGASAVNSLRGKGWVEVNSVPIERDPLAGKRFPRTPAVTLTPLQAGVASEIRAVLAYSSKTPRTFLVLGVTGSGKTEIYLDAVRHCLAQGKRAIILVPEIALTHQTVERFAARFPGRVAVLHSGMSLGERFDQWWKIKQRGTDVVIGSRSAIFSPQPDLGLVVIDEEHEWTYKQQDASPRYHSRTVALKLAELTGSVVVMGSASPDLVSYHLALRGRYRLLRLPERAPADHGRDGPVRRKPSLPAVEVVDMRRELREGNRDIFSRPLVSAMDECMRDGDQMVLFLNRRGAASHVQCRSCGLSVRCRRCDIALTYHRESDRLMCHYCGYRRAVPESCSRCLSPQIGRYGLGTEAVAERVAQMYPDVSVLRWDRDSTRSPRAYEELLTRFRSGGARVLVGTQMIAKGLHFPSVTLVGAVSADIGLNVPDYRSGERVYQLLCQVAGRAGRGPRPGRVVVQTFQPDNYAIQAAARQDYPRFYRREVAFRKEQANPPFSALIRLLYAHSDRSLCEREALRLGEQLRRERDACGYSDIEVLGPTPAYPPRLRGRHRWHLILRGPDPRALLDQTPVPSGWAVDIDPVSLT